VWVTGELGAAAAYVRQRRGGEEGDPEARARFAAPEPRVREALWLAERGLPTAMIDLSDGLAGDAAHLSAASGVAVLLIPELVPVHPAARRHAGSPEEALRLALTGGEDYELCFTAPVGAVTPHLREFDQAFGARLSCVGRLGGGDGVWWVDAEGHRSPLGLQGYQHFGGEETP
ncbi:MAG TPA: hypothetical protein VFR81_10915, partial [Longimicrobium sp.]|nr:hypothetical protein [Longimicrobium sp.]